MGGWQGRVVLGETSFLHNAIACTRARVTSHTARRARGESIVLVACARLSCSLVGYLAGDFLRTRGTLR